MHGILCCNVWNILVRIVYVVSHPILMPPDEAPSPFCHVLFIILCNLVILHCISLQLHSFILASFIFQHIHQYTYTSFHYAFVRGNTSEEKKLKISEILSIFLSKSDFDFPQQKNLKHLRYPPEEHTIQVRVHMCKKPHPLSGAAVYHLRCSSEWTAGCLFRVPAKWPTQTSSMDSYGRDGS